MADHETDMDSVKHGRRLALRKLRTHPLSFLRFIGKNVQLESAARRRRSRRV